jgi:hypothetical protein
MNLLRETLSGLNMDHGHRIEARLPDVFGGMLPLYFLSEFAN